MKPISRRIDVLARFLRIVIFLIGLASSFLFFYNFIGLVIGVSYFILFRDEYWGLHGLFLAFTTSITTVAAHRVTLLSPIMMTMAVGFGSLLIYVIVSVVMKYRGHQASLVIKLQNRIDSLPSRARTLLMILLILSPTLLWSTVSIDLGVMFDNNPRLLWVHAPTTVNLGSDFEVVVEAWDAFERLSAVYKGTVQFSIESYNLTTLLLLPTSTAVLPSTYTFTGQNFGSDIAYMIQDGMDNGLHEFSIQIDTPGYHYILVEDSVTQNTYYSNPIIVRDFSPTDSHIYWGDIHTHSALSDGTGTAEHSFYYARHVACLDYNALTDHGEILSWFGGNFDVLEDATNAAYEPGRFVTFQGIEWTQDSTGHYTCIFSGDQLIKDPVLSRFTITTTDGLWDALDSFTASASCRALALPHHTTKRAYPQDWTQIDPTYVKIAEVCSVHGTFLYEQRHPLNYHGAINAPAEYVNGTSIIDAFNMGLRMTLYASSDEHDGHPGHSLSHTRAFVGHQRPWSMWHTRNEHPYPGGITAVYATDLTRDSVFSGLENQRIFASSDHGRPYLYFSINGTEVGDGSTVQVSDIDAVREIVVTFAQDGSPVALKRTSASVTPNWIPDWNGVIEILKNGELLASIPINSPISTIRFQDSSEITGAIYGSSSCVERNGQFFVNDFSDNPIDPSTLNTNGVDYYLIRAVGENGRIAYAGPIWVEVGV
ncbi:MAG: DUF3604 domain-containing protein [Candidatus Thorarchaeota archaeon]